MQDFQSYYLHRILHFVSNGCANIICWTIEDFSIFISRNVAEPMLDPSLEKKKFIYMHMDG